MIALSMVLLIPTTLILVPLGMAVSNYGIAASFLGFLLLGFSLIGFITPKTGQWARSMFLATVAYLPLLFTALILGAGAQ
jgi:protoheme IX farnesyltransferase